jgi:IclR family transcriptional regulator, pca regulon regulatory protein
MVDNPRSDSDFVQSLVRGLGVIRTFDADHPKRSVSEVAAATGLTRSAARRFLLTLGELGYVGTDGRVFWLEPRILELGFAYLSRLGLPEIAEPHLQRLVEKVHESSSMSVLDGHEIVYVARVATTRIMTVSISIGTRLPAYATSMGRVLLSGLAEGDLDRYLQRLTPVALTDRTITDVDALRKRIEKAADQGWALVDQELEEGLRSIAVPIHDGTSRVVAAVNVSAHASHASVATMKREFLPLLSQAADAIEADRNAGGW